MAVAATHENFAPITEDEIFAAHEGGQLRISSALPIVDVRSLSIAYTPGVARVSQAIAEQPALATRYTSASRLVAIVTDGTSVLGLGNAGPLAAIPVMEGKAALFKSIAGVDAIPLVFNTPDTEEIVRTLTCLRPSFGAVCIEDVASPRCFALEERLSAVLDCPVVHDDQHGTAIAVLAALRGACRVLGRPVESRRVVVVGAGAAGVACADLLLAAGITDVTVLDSRGILHPGRSGMNEVKTPLAERSNPRGLRGGLDRALAGADVLVGLSSSTVPEELMRTMAPEPIVFALSNPTPEIAPDTASRYAGIVATGGSDHPNQVINTLASPGVFRGLLDSGARRLTERMRLAAAEAIAAVAEDGLAADRIVPSSLDPRLAPAVAARVAAAAEV
ncbi:NAD(P)-dependent malic enzyme [Streptomyces macrosporus]|uniref:NADP-dependent malic enzyme n=1 Tax=Streptomyces macrosporus TaxID=44032 RepID=A0ABP5XML1_9ACTN